MSGVEYISTGAGMGDALVCMVRVILLSPAFGVIEPVGIGSRGWEVDSDDSWCGSGGNIHAAHYCVVLEGNGSWSVGGGSADGGGSIADPRMKPSSLVIVKVT